MQISPKDLFPTQSVNSIEENEIIFLMECLKNKNEVPIIKVLQFDGDYYIIEGHHLMLALNRLEIGEIDVQVISPPPNTFWGIRENIIENLGAIGLTALYDFEAIGNFSFSKYPCWYK